MGEAGGSASGDDGDNEVCWFIYGVKLGPLYAGVLVRHSVGTVASVEFNWRQAMSRWVIGWHHTHPPAVRPVPSATDHSTARSWVRAKGRAILCGISCREEDNCYVFRKDGCDIKFARAARVRIGRLLLAYDKDEGKVSI